MVCLRFFLVSVVALRMGIALVEAARHEDVAELLGTDSDKVGNASEFGLASESNTSNQDNEADPIPESTDGAHHGEGTRSPHIDLVVQHPEEHEGAEDPDRGVLPVDQIPEEPQGVEDHDEKDHHGHHHAFSSLDVAVGACFIGFVLIMMSALFMVNHSDHDVRATAYSMVSQTLSIFCAVTFDSVVDEVIDKFALPFWTCLAARALWGFALTVAVSVRVARSDSKVQMIAAGVLGGHMTGYAALEVFGSVQLNAPFKGYVIPTVVACTLLYYFSMKAKLWLAEHMVQGSGEDTREEKIEVIYESVEEAFSFCIGFLISQASKFYVLNFIPKLHGAPEGRSQRDCNMLFGFVGLYCLMVCVLAPLVEFAHGRGLLSTARLVSLAQRTVGMAAAWIVVFAGEWQWFHSSHVFLAEKQSLSSGIMMVTFVNTIVSFGFVIVLDFMADREWIRPASVRAVIAIIATAVGLSWEKAFHEANGALPSGFSPRIESRCRLFLIVAVLLIVLQGWRYYILPQAIEHGEPFEEKETAEESQAEDGQKPAEVSAPQ